MFWLEMYQLKVKPVGAKLCMQGSTLEDLHELQLSF